MGKTKFKKFHAGVIQVADEYFWRFTAKNTRFRCKSLNLAASFEYNWNVVTNPYRVLSMLSALVPHFRWLFAIL
jgi:hypothetical protein